MTTLPGQTTISGLVNLQRELETAAAHANAMRIARDKAVRRALAEGTLSQTEIADAMNLTRGRIGQIAGGKR